MKVRRQWRVLILLVAVLLCLIMARVSFSGQVSNTGRLSLWYLEGDCPPTTMEALVARCREEIGLRLEAQGFPDEQALGSAFEESAPDLLLCSHLRAEGFYSRGGLGALKEPIAYPEALSVACGAVGSGFFPLGSRLSLLLVNTDLSPADFENLEALLAAGEGAPFLTSDSWAELLYSSAFSLGRFLQGRLDADLTNPVSRALYNELAEAAFRGALAPAGENAAAYVHQGLLPCAVVRSGAVAGLTDKNLTLRLLPLPEGGEAQYPAELLGFALMTGAERDAVSRFLHWLSEDGHDADAALSMGLIPLKKGAGGQDNITRALASFAGNAALYYSPADAPFCLNRADLEKQLRAALDLLA